MRTPPAFPFLVMKYQISSHGRILNNLSGHGITVMRF